MNEIHYFPPYSHPENVVTNNTLWTTTASSKNC